MASVIEEAVSTRPVGGAVRRRRQLRLSPWRRPWGLEALTWLYIAWSLVPVALAVLFSFNSGGSQESWQGFSLKWYIGKSVQSVLNNPELHESVLQTLKLAGLTTLITVPLGVAFAIGIDRWRSRSSSGLNLVMVLSFVIPELLLAVALFMLFTQLFSAVGLGTAAEVGGLVVWNLSWPAVVVRARVVTIGRAYEEAATDLGASRLGAVRRVLLPMLMPAILASATLVFASTVDDFVIVEQLSSTAPTQPMSVLIYGNVHGGGVNGPALNALATIMLFFSLLVAALGFVAYWWTTRGEHKQSTAEALTGIAGM